MVEFRHTYHRIFSTFLLSAFLLPMVALEMHIFLEHLEIEERCVVVAGDEHLHEADEFESFCLLCCNTLSEYLDGEFVENTGVLQILVQSEAPDGNRIFRSIRILPISPRGPPFSL